MLLEDKNAVIYGAGGSIGGAVARAFAREGARVFLVGRTREKLEVVARDIAAAAQMLAAVVSPLTTSLRRMIVPAPMNPMPLATCAATREGSRITCC